VTTEEAAQLLGAAQLVWDQAEPEPAPVAAPEQFKPGTRREVSTPRCQRWAVN